MSVSDIVTAFLAVIGLVSGIVTIHSFVELHPHPKIKQSPITITMVVVVIIFLLSLILVPVMFFLGRASSPEPPPTVNHETPTPIVTPSVPATSVPTPTPTPSPTPSVSFSRPITVPSDTEKGFSFTAPYDGTYQITFVDAAYTTYPGSSWVTLIVVYKKNQIQWSNSQQPGPTNYDTYIGSGHPGNSAALAVSYAKTDHPTVTFTLQKDETLRFVAVDVENEYQDNNGQIVLRIELIQ